MTKKVPPFINPRISPQSSQNPATGSYPGQIKSSPNTVILGGLFKSRSSSLYALTTGNKDLQAVRRLLWNPKFQYRVEESAPLYVLRFQFTFEFQRCK